MEFPSLHSPSQGPSHLTLETEVRGLMISTGSHREGPGGVPHPPTQRKLLFQFYVGAGGPTPRSSFLEYLME